MQDIPECTTLLQKALWRARERFPKNGRFYPAKRYRKPVKTLYIDRRTVDERLPNGTAAVWRFYSERYTVAGPLPSDSIAS